MSYQELLSAALALPAKERSELVEELWSSLETEPGNALSEEWMAEIERRSTELDSAAVPGVSWEDVKRDVHQRLRRDEA